ncbi:MAG TPA: sigma-E factor negative regulatory protein [Gallionella sp.]|nr:sigma-E factor negative regulatory protein [Gallionella sp.]
MKKEISAMMDGELFEDEAEVLLEQFKQDSTFDKDWAVYHLIGDVLRQPEHIHSDVSAGVRKRMQDEPTVLAPRGHAVKQKIRTFALSAAASLGAVGVVAWMSIQVPAVTATQVAMRQPAVAAHPANVQIRPKANDYLMAHQEFSPGMDMNNIRTVSYSLDEK